MVFRRDVEGDVRVVNQSKIAFYSCPLEALQTETKGTVLLHTADELKDFSKGEESQMERVRLLYCFCFPSAWSYLIVNVSDYQQHCGCRCESDCVWW